MKHNLNPSNIIKKAGAKVRGTRYDALREICENQKTISTRKVLMFLAKYADADRLDAIQLRDIAQYIRNAEKEKGNGNP